MIQPSITYEGVTYTVQDKFKDELVKRGLCDIYELSLDDNEWLVIEPYIFWSKHLQRFIIAPRWMRTDLASVPQLFQNIIPVNGRHRHPAIGHDVLYVLAHQHFCTKEEADHVLLDFMELFDVPYWKRIAMYSAVKIGGKSAWESKDIIFAPDVHKEFYMREFVQLGLKEENGSFYEDEDN